MVVSPEELKVRCEWEPGDDHAISIIETEFISKKCSVGKVEDCICSAIIEQFATALPAPHTLMSFMSGRI
jgi:hypothetical protein